MFTYISFLQNYLSMDLKQNSSTDWCEDDFDEDDINRPGPSGLKDNTGHFLVKNLLTFYLYYIINGDNFLFITYFDLYSI